MLEKTFQPAEIEGAIYERWEKSGAFAAGRHVDTAKPAESYCIVIPPPNVTGSLHMGHALNNTLQDVLIRFERMRGKDVLWQPGIDHAGIATQSVVERQLMERQEPDRRAMGRDKFIERVWSWKEESGGTIFRQLRRLGASCDWSRERFTMGVNGAKDDQMVRAVTKVFVDLYRAGLIYKDKRLVNWDPKLLTAISDLEVQPKEMKGHLWYFRYPIKGEPARFIVVATTRPETMLGDTGVAVHPEDERYRDLVGKVVVLPLVGREIPIVADDYADPEQGSGAVKITPAHDFNDFEVGRRNDLDIINIFDQHARLNENVPEKYRGLDRFEARKRVVADLEALDLVEKIEPHVNKVPHGDRSDAVIEPWLTDQWYVNAAELAKEAIKAVEDGRTKFVPQNWEKTYFEWMRNIQPWCISRQLWWGHQIPAWYGPDGKIFVAFDDEEARVLARKHYGNKPFELNRDPDVLDTWFSSALWPFSTLGWPDATPELARYYPTSTLVTGFDIIFFWVARMMMMGLHFMKEIPFHTVYVHALVRDEKGQKMSKSKGNVMDPLDIVDGVDLDTLIVKRTAGLASKSDAAKIASETKKAYPKGIAPYGADALRFTLAAMAAPGRDIKLSIPVVEGYRNFATKVWNAARFGEMNGCVPVQSFDPAGATLTINRWILAEAERAAAAVTEGIAQHRYNEAAATIYQFVWNTFCDWYLELAKPALSGPDGAAKDETRAVFAWTFDRILTLLHPFMPFITEELWNRIGENAPRAALLIQTPWPEPAGLGDAAADEEMEWVIRLVTEIRSVRSEMNIPPAAQLPLMIAGAGDAIQARAEAHRETLSRLARLASIEFVETPPKGALQIVTREATLALPVAGVIDIDAESERLKREISRVRGEIEQLDRKLSDDNFTARAPEHVVEENRERRSEAAAAAARLQEALKRLEAAH
jgi:valyl-tRNA synthetase